MMGDERTRSRWESPWLLLLVAAFFGVAWTLLDLFLFDLADNAGTKTLSAVLSALTGAFLTILLQLYARLNRALERFRELDETLTELRKVRSHLLPSLYVSQELKRFHEELIGWREDIHTGNGSTSLVERDSWSAFIDMYFAAERASSATRVFRTTSNYYTRLVKDGSAKLERETVGPCLRVHVTGMLPEEFYNGAQIEFSHDHSRPLFLSHRWEGYDLNEPEYGSGNRTRVRRYITVRDPEFRRAELSALPSLDDLREQTKLTIVPQSKRFSTDLTHERPSVLRRLLGERERAIEGAAEEDGTLRQRFRGIHGTERYTYYPVAEQGLGPKARPLLDCFVDDHHRKVDADACYCALDSAAWAICERHELLFRCFETGWIPEVALFASGDTEADARWHFGILGLWRPFTRDIKLTFLTAREADQLYAAFREAHEAAEKTGPLRSLAGASAAGDAATPTS